MKLQAAFAHSFDTAPLSCRARTSLRFGAAVILAILCAFAPARAQTCSSLPSGCLGWWPGDGSLADIQGTNQGAAVNAVSFEPGLVGQGFSLKNSAVVCPGNYGFSLSNELTFEAWFMLRKVTGYNGIISALTSDGRANLRLMVSPSLGMFFDTGGHDHDFTAGGPMTLNEFHHAAMTIRGGGEARVYLDGQSIYQSSQDVPGALPGSSAILLGAGETQDLYRMEDGVLDEASIYNRVLAPEDILAIFNAGAAGKCKSPGLLPEIGSGPMNVSAVAGQSVVFRVEATGPPPLGFQWRFNGSDLLGETNDVLSIVCSSATAGSYSVRVSNRSGATFSNDAVLTLQAASDRDGDGIPDYWEILYGLNPDDPSDAVSHPVVNGQTDKLTYVQKYLYGLDPKKIDTDGDGLSDYDEIFVYHTNPLLADTDGDGIPDGWEVQHGLNPMVKDAGVIGPAGVSNLQIYQYDQDLTHTNQLDPRNPFFAPGTSIYEVLNNGQHTNRFYYDHEDRLVGAEYSRGVSIAYTYDGNGNILRQTLLSRANETNGLPVLWQFLNGLTNGTPADGLYGDPDGDGWSNIQEYLAGTDPNDSNSRPSLLENPGTSIASLSLPFTPKNFVVGVGDLDGLPGDEIVLGADGNPGASNNSIVVLTQTAIDWSSQQIDVGAFGVTSIAIGQPAGRSRPGIYLGLRGPDGTGQILEFTQSNGSWQSNTVAISTDAAFVVGIRNGTDVLASLSLTNAPDGALWSLTWSNTAWAPRQVSTNTGHAAGLVAALETQQSPRTIGLRSLDSGGIELFDSGLPLVNGGSLVPPGAIYNPATDKWYFTTPKPGTWDDVSASCSSFGGNLVTISSETENEWVQAHFPNNYFIGLSAGFVAGGFSTRQLDPSNGGWVSGSQSNYRNWAPGQPQMWANPNSRLAVAYKDQTGQWSLTDAVFVTPGPGLMPAIGEVRGADWSVVIPDLQGVQALRWPRSELAAGSLVAASASSLSVYRAVVDDKNSSGQIDSGDDFVISEYDLQTTSWTTNVFARIPIASSTSAPAFGITLTGFLDGLNCLFSAEPDGQLFVWTSDNNTSPARQLFSGDYRGKSWHALSGLKMPAAGEGLVGLLVDPTNQAICSAIFWPPQAVFSSPQYSVIETAPSGAVLPSDTPLEGLATVSVRIWDAEGNDSTLSLQYQILGASAWQKATITSLDGAPYTVSTQVTALPTGSNHTIAWTAAADLGAMVSTNVLLRLQARDSMLVGDWSAPTQFQVNISQDINGLPTSWELKYFGHLGVDPNADADGDGMSNYAEYRAGTDPTDPNSSVHFTAIEIVQGGTRLQWEAGTTIPQYLQRRLDLSDTEGWQDVFTNSVPVQGEFLDRSFTNNASFYRIRIGP